VDTDLLNVDQRPIPRTALLSLSLSLPTCVFQRVQGRELDLQGCDKVLELLNVVVHQFLVTEQNAPCCPPESPAQVVPGGVELLTAMQQHAKRCAHQMHLVATVRWILFLSSVKVFCPYIQESMERGKWYLSLRVAQHFQQLGTSCIEPPLQSHVGGGVEIRFVFAIIFKEFKDMENSLPERNTRTPRRGSRGKGQNRNFREGQKKEPNGSSQKPNQYKHFIWKDSAVDGWQNFSRENLHRYCLAMKSAHESNSSAIYRARVQQANLGLRINELIEKAEKENRPSTNYQRDVQDKNAQYYDQLARLFSDANIVDEEIEKQLQDVRASTTNAIRELKKKYQLKEKADLSGANKASEATSEQLQYDPDDPHQQVVVFQSNPEEDSS
jgi:uncharacterized protein YdcH (DUF465 family)